MQRADACFGQPYSLIEMQERMQTLRRAASPVLTPGLAIRPSLKLDVQTRELVAGECRMALIRREYLLFECLLRDLNSPLPRDQLIRYVWPEKNDVDPSSVNLMVARLRRKLSRSGILFKARFFDRPIGGFMREVVAWSMWVGAQNIS